MTTVGSLFSGIGGIDLGLERAGFEVRWQAETNPYASRVLAKHWPHVPNLGDVTKIDWENDGLDHGDGIARSLHVDLVAGGFPCQPVSVAGRRLAQLDDRWLWPEFERCVRLLEPRWVLVENVPGLLVRGMGDVLGGLARLGYDAEWESLPAAAVGAPHLRWRVFIVARAEQRRSMADPGGGRGPVDELRPGRDEPRGRRQDVAYARCQHGRTGLAVAGRDGQPEPADELERCGPLGDPDRSGRLEQRRSVAVFEEHAAPGWWGAEPDVGRMAHGVPGRVDRLRCLGNAVVPQVAEFVGRRIAHIDGQADG